VRIFDLPFFVMLMNHGNACTHGAVALAANLIQIILKRKENIHFEYFIDEFPRFSNFLVERGNV